MFTISRPPAYLIRETGHRAENRPKVKEFLTAIKNKSTFAIAKSIFFCFFRRNFASRNNKTSHENYHTYHERERYI